MLQFKRAWLTSLADALRNLICVSNFRSVVFFDFVKHWSWGLNRYTLLYYYSPGWNPQKHAALCCTAWLICFQMKRVLYTSSHRISHVHCVAESAQRTKRAHGKHTKIFLLITVQNDSKSHIFPGVLLRNFQKMFWSGNDLSMTMHHILMMKLKLADRMHFLS